MRTVKLALLAAACLSAALARGAPAAGPGMAPDNAPRAPVLSAAGLEAGDKPLPPPAPGLPALLKRAIPRDPQVMAAAAALRGAEARYKQARSRMLPNLGLESAKGRSNDLDLGQPVDRRTQTVDATLRWNIANGGADMAELRASWRDVAAAEADLRKARDDCAEKLADAYFDVQRLNHTLALSLARLSEVGQLVALVARQTEAGKASQLDTQQAQSSQLDAELTQDSLLAERDAALVKLQVLAGEAVPELREFTFAQPLADLDPGDSAAPLSAAKERAAAARLRVRSWASTMAPKVDVQLRRNLNNHTDPAPTTISQRGWSIGINWDIPLGGESQYRRNETISRADQADAEVLRVGQVARAERDSLPARIASAERSLALLDAQVVKMAALVHGTGIQFEAGRRNLQQIIQTRDSYFSVQQRRIEQSHKLLLAQMRQRTLAGQLLPAFGLADERTAVPPPN